MNAALLVVALSAVGIDHGWQPLPEGGVEYILQIEPQIFESLRSQSDVESYLPPGLDVKKIRVTVGNAKLPKDAGDDAAGNNAAGDASAARANNAADATDNTDNSAEEPAAFDAAAELASASELPEAEQPFARRLDSSRDRNLVDPADEEVTQDNSRDDSTREGGFLKGDFPVKPNQKRQREATQPQDWEANKQPALGNETGPGEEKSSTKKAAQAEKPWLPLTVTALALCLSLAANFYLAWIARDARQRYRDLLDQVQSPTAAAA